MIVNRRPFEQPLFHSFSFSGFIVSPLENDRQIFYEEYTAENRYQQFFMDDDGEYGNDSANRQTAGISHEYLCRIGIVPEEADQCTDKGADVNYELFRSRNVHNVQIAGKLNV